MTPLEPTQEQVFDNLGRPIVTRLYRPRTFLQRLRGLIGRHAPGRTEGWWYERCAVIHTFWMRYPVDVLHLSESCVVLAIRHRLAPGRFSWFPKTHQILELGSGCAETLALYVGQKLEIRQ